MDGLESKRRLVSTLAGAIFGMGWLIFIDEIVHFNSCLDRVTAGDPCNWGKPPHNFTVAAPANIPSLSFPEDSLHWFPSNWNSLHPFDVAAPGTPAPPPPHEGWHDISGRFNLVYLPGCLALLSIFFVNTIEARHITTEAEWQSSGATIALRIWLFFGLLVGLGACVLAVWVHVDLFVRHDDIKDDPGIAGVIQVLLLMISSLLFWIARSIGTESELSDPFL